MDPRGHMAAAMAALAESRRRLREVRDSQDAFGADRVAGRLSRISDMLDVLQDELADAGRDLAVPQTLPG